MYTCVVPFANFYRKHGEEGLTFFTMAHFSPNEKSLVVSVYNFFEKERNGEGRLHLRRVRRRTARACNISESTVSRCRRESRRQGEEDEGNRVERRGRKAIVVDDFTRSQVRRLIHGMFRHREYPTVEKAFVLCKEELPDFPAMGKTTFWKLLRSIGFRYVKTKGCMKTMMERNDIVAWRHRFLREMQEIREDGRPVVVLDETWVNSHHTVSRQWYDEGAAEERCQPHEAPSGKGKRLIILHAGTKDGFLPDCELVFVGNTNSADYHDEMNAAHFQEWWQTKLLPNLPPGAVIVMDNAPYHTVKTDSSRCPTSSTTKADMQKWLTEKGIQWRPDMLKAELYSIIKQNKCAPVYVCDELALQQGFCVVRLPPYHCVFNPIELMWAWIKEQVAKRNTTFKIADVKELVTAVITEVSAEHWRKAFEHCEKCMDEAWVNDGLQEEHVERLIIEVGEDDSSSSSSSDSDSDMSLD